MANVLYPKGKQNLLEGDIDLITDTIKVVLIDLADYTYVATQENFDEVPAAARVATATLAGKSVVDGIFDADDAVFTSVTGDISEALIIYQDSGVESTSKLLVYIDTGTGLPIEPVGADITVSWDDGASKIFAL